MINPDKRVEIHPDGWYSVDAVARYMDLSRDTIIRQIQAGQLAAITLPAIGLRKTRRRAYRTYRIKGAGVLAWIAASELKNKKTG